MTKRGQPSILGLWDARAQAPGLGGLIVLVAEAQARAAQLHGGVAGICFVDGGRGGPMRPVEADGAPLGGVLLAFKGIDRLYRAPDLDAAREFMSASSGAIVPWPALDTADHRGLLTRPYGDSRPLQQMHREGVRIPAVEMKSPHVQWALELYDRRVAPRLPVVVHLKNAPGGKGESNADFDAWHGFLEACRDRADVAFLLIGNEPVDPRISGLPNVLQTRALGASLPGELALIQTAFAYMGMASGPCAMAMFGPAPYLLFKNPGHHEEQMALELGGAERFPFARPGQKLLRVRETRDNLRAGFEELMSFARRSDWERRIDRLRSPAGSAA